MHHPETIAIIDLGTNTFHLLIVELTIEDTFVVKDKYKEAVKLGEGSTQTGVITEVAFERGLKALSNFRKIMDMRKVGNVFAYATSAIRNASNGKEFIMRAKDETGIEIKLINGNEEALLIYKGVKNSVQLPQNENVLMIDIGGGSVEFVVGNAKEAKLLRSIRIGTQRILEYICPSDPITTDEIEKLNSFFREELTSLMGEIQEFKINRIIGSSGTFSTLGALAARDGGDRLSLDNLNGYCFSSLVFKGIYKQLLGTKRSVREKNSLIDPIRVDTIVVSSLLVNYLIESLDIKDIVVSNYALKEGILYDYIEKGRVQKHNAGERSLREKAVRVLGSKFGLDVVHSDLVGRLSLSLFDQLQVIHGYGDDEREFLLYAAILHDIGHFINRSSYHKHGQYLVMNSGLAGFNSDELLIIGNLVRYHRKSLPTREHMHYNILYKEHKLAIRRLSGILRIAANLDRGHRGLVRDVKVQISDNEIDIGVISNENIDFEIQHCEEEKELLATSFEKQVVIRPIVG